MVFLIFALLILLHLPRKHITIFCDIACRSHRCVFTIYIKRPIHMPCRFVSINCNHQTLMILLYGGRLFEKCQRILPIFPFIHNRWDFLLRCMNRCLLLFRMNICGFSCINAACGQKNDDNCTNYYFFSHKKILLLPRKTEGFRMNSCAGKWN